MLKESTMKIRALNDQLWGSVDNAVHPFSFQVAIVASLSDVIQQAGPEKLIELLTAVRTSAQDAVTEDADPHGEHDFVAFEFDGKRIFAKISYYDLALEMHSPDATDSSVTMRVCSIFYAEDY